MDFSRPNVDYADLLRLAQNATKPSVARVTGACLAGGMGLLCMTDMAVAADHALFGLPEVKVGVFPMQVMSLLQSIAPRRLINEWALTGEPFDANAALAAGLVNHVAPAAELDAKVDWLVGRIRRQVANRNRRGKYASVPSPRLRSTRRSPIREPDRAAGDDRGRQGRLKALPKAQPPGPDVSGIAVCGPEAGEAGP